MTRSVLDPKEPQSIYTVIGTWGDTYISVYMIDFCVDTKASACPLEFMV